MGVQQFAFLGASCCLGPLAGDRVVDELLGEFAGLGGSDGPGDDVTGVDLDDHEQLVVDAPGGI